MSVRTQSLLRWLLSQAPTVLVLAVLAGLGLWGSCHDFTLPPLDWWLGKGKPPEEKEERAKDPTAVRLDSGESAEKAGVEVRPARAEDVEYHVSAHAVLAFDQTRYAHLATRAAGTVWRVDRGVGDRVTKGEVLALVASPEVGKAKADFLQALVQVEVRDQTLRQLQSAAGSVSERQLRNAQVALREARIRLLNDRQGLTNLGLPLRLADVTGLDDEKVARRLRTLGLPRELLGRQDASALPGNLLPLRAPFDGLVIRRDMVEGERVGPERPQFVVADVRRLWVLLDVRLEDVARLEVGQPVTFRADATGQAATGTLTWVSAEVDPKTRTVRARAEVANPDGTLRPATFGTARVLVGRRAKVLAVPSEAVQWDGTAHRVFVRRDARTFRPRLVLPGRRAGGMTELLCDPQALLAAGTVGLGGAPGGPLLSAGALPFSGAVLGPVRPGDLVAARGSHVLKSEMLRERIEAGE